MLSQTEAREADNFFGAFFNKYFEGRTEQGRLFVKATGNTENMPVGEAFIKFYNDVKNRFNKTITSNPDFPVLKPKDVEDIFNPLLYQADEWFDALSLM